MVSLSHFTFLGSTYSPGLFCSDCSLSFSLSKFLSFLADGLMDVIRGSGSVLMTWVL